MILVVREAFINLSSSQCEKAVGHNGLDRLTRLQKGDHVRHAEPNPFDNDLAAGGERLSGSGVVGGVRDRVGLEVIDEADASRLPSAAVIEWNSISGSGSV